MELPPQATLVLARLKFADWNATKIDLFEWFMQRTCFFRHPDGVDSHLGIRFENRSNRMIEDAKRVTDLSSLAASQARTAIWEVVQHKPSGFRVAPKRWVCDWKTPTHFYYEFSFTDTQFVEALHHACVEFMLTPIVYAASLRYNAVLCQAWPDHCCAPADAVNCVNATLLVIAAAIKNDATIAKERNLPEAQQILKSHRIPAGYTPYEAISMLAHSGVVRTLEPHRLDTAGVKKDCPTHSLLPGIMLRL